MLSPIKTLWFFQFGFIDSSYYSVVFSFKSVPTLDDGLTVIFFLNHSTIFYMHDRLFLIHRH